jgi:hypothetical protein
MLTVGVVLRFALFLNFKLGAGRGWDCVERNYGKLFVMDLIRTLVFGFLLVSCQ